MLLLCCTKKLRDYWRIKVDREDVSSTTVLGDWYANIVETHKGAVILCVNEYTRMSIVCQLSQNPAAFLAEFSIRMAILLKSMDIPDERIAQELKEMQEVVFRKTNSRSTLGTMNDFAYHIDGYIEDDYVYAPVSFDQISGMLCDTPIGPKEYFFPTDRVYERFGQEPKRWTATESVLFEGKVRRTRR